MLVFIVVYGLDWVATVPPTAVLCRRIFGERGTIVFGGVFAATLSILTRTSAVRVKLDS